MVSDWLRLLNRSRLRRQSSGQTLTYVLTAVDRETTYCFHVDASGR